MLRLPCHHTDPCFRAAFDSSKGKDYANGSGVVFLARVALGRVYEIDRGTDDSSDPRPPGYDSVRYFNFTRSPYQLTELPRHIQVVFNKDEGRENETVVYTDDAIRPVFLILL
jgi:hypothetical protein